MEAQRGKELGKEGEGDAKEGVRRKNCQRYSLPVFDAQNYDK